MITQVLVGAAAFVLSVAAGITLVRLARGPSGLDRGVAADVLVAILVAAVGAWTVWQRTPVALGILLVLSLVGFAGTVALARLITTSNAREQRFRDARVQDAYLRAPGSRPRDPAPGQVADGDERP